MDRLQLLLLGLPVFLFCSDLFHIFTPPHLHHRPQPQPQSPPTLQPVGSQTLNFPTQKTSGFGGVGVGNTIGINFCTSCSYKGNAVTMKNMLETSFPGINVILANHPPPLPKRLLGKVVPVAQVVIIGIVMAGEHIFPRLGFVTPPHWYYSLRANRFGTISTTWLLGNFIQSFLQSSGAFEVYHNYELVFSKLKEQRFPGEIELKDIVGKRLPGSTIVDTHGENMWS